MQYTTLGRTGLRVSMAGLGCGGHSRLGLSRHDKPDQAKRIIHEALDLGVNLIDTAQDYANEAVVGEALGETGRDDIVLCTKIAFCRHVDGADVILTGTGNVEHLRANIAAITAEALPDDTLQRLDALFGQIDSVSGN